MRKVAFEDAGMAPATIQLLQAAAQPELIRNQPVLSGVVHLGSTKSLRCVSSMKSNDYGPTPRDGRCSDAPREISVCWQCVV